MPSTLPNNFSRRAWRLAAAAGCALALVGGAGSWAKEKERVRSAEDALPEAPKQSDDPAVVACQRACSLKVSECTRTCKPSKKKLDDPKKGPDLAACLNDCAKAQEPCFKECDK